MSKLVAGLVGGLLLCWCVSPGPWAGAEVLPQQDPHRIRMVKTDTPPRLDGRLDDPAWARAAVLSEFTQADPHEGAAPSEKTVVSLLYDTDYLYLGIRAFDSAPEQIVAKERQRDIQMDGDDTIAIALDPFHERRRGYYFQINPLANRLDGLISPDTNTDEGRLVPNFDWDGIWYAEAVMDEQGWTAEVAIPMKTVSFDPANDTWGFNIERFIARKNETIRWTAASRNKRVVAMGDAGQLTGLVGLHEGLGLDVVPYAKFKGLREEPGAGERFIFKPGGDLTYKVTPSVTATLTVNTDFAEAEVDQRKVNLTRFPLLFQEKRRFFLQDANYFQFGGLQTTLIPFFSRRIGLGADRTPIDLLAGLKMTGQVGRTTFGLLNIQTDDTGGLHSKNLTVGRATVRLLEESAIGVIATNGDPLNNNKENHLGGVDFTYKSSKFLGSSQVLEAHGYLMRSESDGLSGNAFGGRLLYPNFTWDAGVIFDQIDTHFNPALGFLEQQGIRDYQGWVGRRWQPPMLYAIQLQASGSMRTTLDNRVVQSEFDLPTLIFETKARDTLSFAPLFVREQFFEPFDLVPGVVIPPGDYHYVQYHVLAETAKTRSVSGIVHVDTGEYLKGRRTNLETFLTWRPDPLFNLSGEYSQSKIAIPTGKFTVHIARLHLNFSFTRNLSWNLVQQYDNVSNAYGVNSRIRWAIQPGSDLFLVFNHNADTADAWRATSSNLSAKIVWTIRF